MSMPKILVVDDNRIVRNVLEMQLVTHGYEVTTAGSGPEAVAAASANRPDLLILDLTLDTDPLEAMRNGFMLLAWLRRTVENAWFPVIVHTADKSPKIDKEADEHGVYAVFRKGESTFKLLELIRCALQDRKAA
jgi:two-component system, OmpR family, KDP operon response regulator KdpE